MAPIIPISIASIAGAHNQARSVKGVPTSSSTSRTAAALALPTLNDNDNSHDNGGDDDNEDDDESASTTALTARSITMIATRARCHEALGFLRYVKRLLHDKRKDEVAAASAATGHGWDWVEDNCRCGVVACTNRCKVGYG